MSNQQHTPKPAGYAVMTPFGNVYRFANTLESAKRKQEALISKFPNKKQGPICELYTAEHLTAELSMVTKQRDELLAALLPDAAEKIAREAFLFALSGGHIADLYKQPERMKLRDAIAGISGEKCKTCGGQGGWEAAASSTSYFWKACPDCASEKGGAQ